MVNWFKALGSHNPTTAAVEVANKCGVSERTFRSAVTDDVHTLELAARFLAMQFETGIPETKGVLVFRANGRFFAIATEAALSEEAKAAFTDSVEHCHN